ncbi:Abi family protein [Bifidobacterium pseudolongum]|uniref:Abi family protein n=1 Tax=Bifidobacterium pseudolongum TaxID=1694 RepID=UPI001021EB91|nr:Abi family protein [Bifidobacterium pseudolongum]
MRNNIELFPNHLSQARLQPYITEAAYYTSRGNTLEQAIELYRWNLSFSAELYKAIACIEIPLRNALDKTLHQFANRQELATGSIGSAMALTTMLPLFSTLSTH